jgi:SUKH-3 immunity protein of toxin-antitoxin system
LRQLQDLAARRGALIDEADTLLRSAGWTEERRVPVDKDLTAIRTAGYPAWEKLIDFVVEYSGLVIQNRDGTRSLWIDPSRAVDDVDHKWVDDYGRLVGSELVPVGGYSHMTIYLGRDGALYGGFDKEFGPLGTDVQQLVAGILTQVPPTPLRWTLT